MHNMINVESHNCVFVEAIMRACLAITVRLTLLFTHCSSHTPLYIPFRHASYIPDSAFFLHRSSYIALAFLIQHYSYTVPPALLLHY